MGRLSANWLKQHGFANHDTLIETGSKSGTGIKYCGRLFRECHTIELSYVKFRAVKAFLSKYKTVQCHHGDSATEIAKIANPKRKTLFWLDAHFVKTDPTSAGAEDQCPLMRELAAIFAVPWRTPPTMIVDDAHLFQESYWRLSRSKGYDKKQFPRVAEIEALCASQGFTVRAFEDTLVIEKAVPA